VTASGELAVPVRASVVLHEPVDACLVTVKATQLAPAPDRLRRERLDDALLVPLLNRVEHVEFLRFHRPVARTVARPSEAREAYSSGRPV
jgi:2-dehydropantoate 2-reductase